MKLIILLTSILALAVAVPRKVPHPDIINGKEAEPHSIPYIAWITINTGLFGKENCGGTLISPNYVLTAGHCVYEGSTGTVLLGAHNRKKNEDTQVEVKVKKYITHPKFVMANISYDIGLIELAHSINETNSIKFGILPSRSEVNKTLVDVIAKASGWGLTKGTGRSNSDILMYIEEKIISNEECLKKLPNVWDYNICITGENNMGGCNGDSGGPLYADGKLVGLTSFGRVNCPEGYPTAYTRVDYFLDWIEENSDVKIKD